MSSWWRRTRKSTGSWRDENVKSERNVYWNYAGDPVGFHGSSLEEWQAERDNMIKICQKCHSGNFARENLKNADLMIKEADKLMAEAIEIVADLYRDGIIAPPEGKAAYPDLLTFYDAATPIEQELYVMFLEHRMRAFQGAFHMNPDYTTWYGFAEMKKDLVFIRSEAERMRSEAKK